MFFYCNCGKWYVLCFFSVSKYQKSSFCQSIFPKWFLNFYSLKCDLYFEFCPDFLNSLELITYESFPNTHLWFSGALLQHLSNWRFCCMCSCKVILLQSLVGFSIAIAVHWCKNVQQWLWNHFNNTCQNDIFKLCYKRTVQSNIFVDNLLPHLLW